MESKCSLSENRIEALEIYEKMNPYDRKCINRIAIREMRLNRRTPMKLLSDYMRGTKGVARDQLVLLEKELIAIKLRGITT